ncbi:MAG: hypothetical protein HY586_03435, partial [Candidatus Omnitrophica bacterium]|nr:hypothetical protein [Candidatus Omnitrophota bacterium]
MAHRKWVRVVSVFMVCVFTISSVAEASITSGLAVPSNFSENPLSPGVHFSGLDPNVCVAEETWISPKSAGSQKFPQVVLFREAHMNSGSQKNIAKSLEYIASETGIQGKLVIGVEGAPTEEITPVAFQAFPDRDIRKAVSEAFLKEGYLDGAGLYAANHEAKVFGLEERALYEKHLSSYRRFSSHQNELVAQLGTISGALERAKERVYTGQLRKLDQSRRKLDRNMENLPKHIRLLRAVCKTKNMNFDRFEAIQKMEEAMDRGSFDGVLPSEFFQELGALETALFARLARSLDEKKLVVMDRSVSLLSALAALALTRDELDELLALGPEIRNQRLWKEAEDILLRRQIQLHPGLSAQMASLISRLEGAFEYYQLALERDNILARNAKVLARNHERAPVYLVTGGFHTEGITQYLRGEGISYTVLAPKASKPS